MCASCFHWEGGCASGVIDDIPLGGAPSNLPVDMSSKEGPVGVVVTVSFGVSVLGGIPSNFPVSISSKEGLFPIGI